MSEIHDKILLDDYSRWCDHIEKAAIAASLIFTRTRFDETGGLHKHEHDLVTEVAIKMLGVVAKNLRSNGLASKGFETKPAL